MKTPVKHLFLALIVASLSPVLQARPASLARVREPTLAQPPAPVRQVSRLPWWFQALIFRLR